MSQQVVIGAALAAVFWAISGIAALFSPTGDASERTHGHPLGGDRIEGADRVPAR